MAKILSDEQCQRIKALNKEFNKYAERGWMCEGGVRNAQVCNVLFNNDTDEIVWASYCGCLIEYDLKGTSLDDVREMVRIQGEISMINES